MSHFRQLKEHCCLRPGGNFLPRRSDTNDRRDSPSFVTGLKRGTHDMDLDQMVKIQLPVPIQRSLALPVQSKV